MSLFLSGMLVTGYLVSGLFFLKFYRRSGDRLFLMFAVALWVLAGQRAMLGFLDLTPSNTIYIYGLRLGAFLLIALAILDKNRQAPSR